MRHSPSRPHATGPGWQPVAGWYKKHLESPDTFQKTLVYPGVLKLLEAQGNRAYLDVACGEGSFAALLSQKGALVVGFDIAPALIARAQKRNLKNAKFFVSNAAHFTDKLQGQTFDGAICILAAQNMKDAQNMFQQAYAALKPGAAFVIVLNHPVLRIPRQSSWGFDEEKKTQYRRIDRYMTPMEIPILMRPGEDRSVKTMSYHHPLSSYFQWLADAGFAVDALEEWTSAKESKPGKRAKAENRSREEFPLFMAIRARKK